jgi:hypothetical protein
MDSNTVGQCTKLPKVTHVQLVTPLGSAQSYQKLLTVTNADVQRIKLLTFFSTGISDTVPHRLLLQAGSNTTMITRHHHHHY